jgi:hypothetical protein
VDGRWVPIDALLEELDRDDWADRIAAQHIAGEQSLAEEREQRGVPLSPAD